MKKYYLELETDNREAEGYEDIYHWVNYDMIYAEGDTLEELLDNATIGLMDQDGGEVSQVEANADWMIDLIKEEFNHRYMQAYSYRVKHPVLYHSETNRVYLDGWIEAMSQDEAINKLCDLYHIESDEIVKLSHSGTWAEVLKDIKRGD